MKLFKKTLSIILAVTMLAAITLSATACGEKKSYTIGISQLVTHDALDAATNGFKQAVIDELGEENVTFLYRTRPTTLPSARPSPLILSPRMST